MFKHQVKDILKLSAAVMLFVVVASNVEVSDAVEATTPAISNTREAIQSQIQEKNQKLQDINIELQKTQTTLNEVEKEKTTLQTQVKTLDSSIKQINLGIQSTQTTAQKVTLEIQDLNYDISDIQQSIETKKVAITSLFREYQRESGKSTLLLLLENKTLEEGLAASQAVDNVRTQLTDDILEMRALEEQYSGKIQVLGGKKEELVFKQEELKNKKLIAEDTKQEKAELLSQTKSKESIYQKQLAELKKLQEDAANEIEALDAQLRLKIDPSLLPTLSSGVLGMPIIGTLASQTRDCKLQNCTQGYGATSFAVYGYKGKWHNGVDFGIPIGTPILAAESGVVLAVGDQDKYCYKGAYGKFVLIKHDNNLTTLSAHFSKYLVTAGTRVTRGQVIGYSGKSGYATGPHLHFSVFATPTIPPASPGFAEGTKASKSCGPMPYGGDLNPLGYL